MDADVPLACIVHAIPEGERAAHFAVLTKLFRTRAQEMKDVPNGYAFRFADVDFDLVPKFVSRERLCCPFLTFTIAVASVGGPVWLEMTGPNGTREFLAAELPSDARRSGPVSR
jgi:hypothetical protein